MERLIPPYLFASLLALTVLLRVVAPASFEIGGVGVLWILPVVVGVVVLSLGHREFDRRAAEVHTFKTPHSMVTSGIFRYTRNPMYLGFLLVLLGGMLFAHSWLALVAPLGFFAASQFWYIPHEEAKLRAVFGAQYEAYTAQTRRWI